MIMRLFFLSFLLISAYASAETFSRDIIPINADPSIGLEIEIENNQRTYQIGETISFNVSALKDGYITLWEIGSSKSGPKRIFPNQFSHNHLFVRAGENSSIGGDSTNFTFEVTGPPGRNDIYAIWSETLAKQPRQPSFEDTESLTRRLSKYKPTKVWASDHTYFDIIPAKPRFDVNRDVYILAMGANTDGLQWTDNDAQIFADRIGTHFKSHQVQKTIIKETTRNQFIDNLNKIARKAKRNDLVFIYFSGHGLLVRDDNGDERGGSDAVFITSNVERDGLTKQAVVRDDEYASLIQAIPTDNIISIIDACHSGGMQKSLIRKKVKFYTGRFKDVQANNLIIDNQHYNPYPVFDDVKGVVLAATEENYKALETYNGGQFTLSLLDNLQIAKPGESFFDIFNRTREDVRYLTSNFQSPVLVGDEKIVDQLRLTTY